METLYYGWVPLAPVKEANQSPLTGEQNTSLTYFNELHKDRILKVPGTRGDRGRSFVILPLMTRFYHDLIAEQHGTEAARQSVVPLGMPDYFMLSAEEVERLKAGDA
ncbi:MAG: hypothetical protein NXH95_02600 [Pseudomonadaceae bacterium]|nr:hypothetical protein [Pseudomonadaceae bacterium]